MTYSNLTDAYLPVYGKSYSPRAYPVQKVTVHHMAGDLTIEGCQSVFAVPGREASSNYGIGSDGRIGCYVPEEDGGWTSSSWWNDNQAITIEVADEDTVNWVPSEAAYESTVKLCADICTRYGIEPYYDGTQNGTFTEHMMFSSTGCPGPWWHAHMPMFVEDVRKEMEGEDMPSAQEVAEAVWGYNYKGTARQNNMYDQDCVTYDMVKRLEKKVEAMSAKVDKIAAGNVDEDKLANAVADKIAKRMQQ
ncbi:MAG: N-acetylmuramoyl-L-alanine amidase [Pseudomonas sp.]|nr:N-acetylmuramoyl-L-alanine amidase [Pseudomonas sp.]